MNGASPPPPVRASHGPSRGRAWLALSGQERTLAIRLAFLVGACSLGLRTLGARRMAAWARRLARPRSHADADLTVAAAVKALQRIVRHSPAPGTCLSRSLALQRWLSAHGIESTLHLGGRLVDGTLDAHAWVERNGTILNDAADVAHRFTPLHAGSRPPS
jgi:hypothetical protein